MSFIYWVMKDRYYHQTWEFSYRVPLAYFKNCIGSSKKREIYTNEATLLNLQKHASVEKAASTESQWVWRRLSEAEAASDRINLWIDDPQVALKNSCDLKARDGIQMVPHFLLWVPQACLLCLRLFTSLALGCPWTRWWWMPPRSLPRWLDKVWDMTFDMLVKA